MAHYKPSALFEQFRGKIGNSVFTANRAGNNLRTYVVPSNPKTSAQVAIRDLFTTVAALWFTLSTAARSAWVSFANSGYIALNRSINTLGYTGRQAFSALRTCVLYVNDFIGQYDLLNNVSFNFAGDDLSDLTLLPLNPIDNPPSVWSPSTTFGTSDGNATLEDFSIVQAILQNDAITITLTLEFDHLNNAVGAQGLSNGGSAIGFGLYLSNALKADGQSVVSPFQKKFLSSPLIGGGTSLGQGTNDNCTISWSFLPNAFTLLNGWYYVTLVIFDGNGQQYPVMSKYFEFTVE